jgi:hypothetical protein
MTYIRRNSLHQWAHRKRLEERRHATVLVGEGLMVVQFFHPYFSMVP